MDENEEKVKLESDSLGDALVLDNVDSVTNVNEVKDFINFEETETKQNINFKPDYQVVTADERTDQQSIYDIYHSDEDICEILDERNVLLLGETGVGKSTFINSLANYVKFKDFYSALYSKIEVLSPCEFTICDDNLQNRKFRFGSESDGEWSAGQSFTERCLPHEIRHGNHLLRIFDTPGLGDTRGVEQDKLNMEETFNVLSKYDELHCICVVLKSNETKLTTTFQYSIKQFLFQLPKKAVSNIVFLFTHSRGTFFKPGDTVEPLRVILGSIKATPPHVDIPLDTKNMFCLDNEAFKFLLAFQNGVELSEDQREQYAKSWEKSGREGSRLIELITGSEVGSGLKPYAMDEFLCVANVRRAVDELRNPLIQTMENTLDNLKLLSLQIQEIRNCGNDKNQLREVLSRPVVRFKIKELDRPRTVCNSNRCVKNYRVNNTEKSHFAQVCCDPCECPLDDIVAVDKLRHCAAFDQQTGRCLKCNCSFSQHKRICYETVIEMNENAVEINQSNVIEIAEKSAEDLRLKSEKLKSEKEKLIKHAAKLAVFLKQNAIFPYKDKFEEIFRLKIQCEQMLMKGGWNDSEGVESLEGMLASYRKEVNGIERVVEVDEVMRTIAELCKMESSGEVLAVAIKAQIKKELGSSNARWIKIIVGVTTGLGFVGLAGALVFAPPMIIPAAVVTAPAALATAWIFLKGLWNKPPAVTDTNDQNDMLKSISTSHNLIYSE